MILSCTTLNRWVKFIFKYKLSNESNSGIFFGTIDHAVGDLIITFQSMEVLFYEAVVFSGSLSVLRSFSRRRRGKCP